MNNPTDDQNPEQPRRWRDVLPIHPAAKLFPLMPLYEIRELADDIKKHGLRELVSLYDSPVAGRCVIDGRNRLDALGLLGWGIIDYDTLDPVETHFQIVGNNDPSFDPYAYVLSKNLHRRHLTRKQRHDLIAKVLKAKPEASNRQVAKQVKADDKTVAKVRADLEARADIPHVSIPRDTKGRRQTVHRPTIVEVASPTAPDETMVVSVRTVEPTPTVSAIDLIGLPAAFREVELQAAAGNKTMLKAALGNLITEASVVLKTLGGLQ